MFEKRVFRRLAKMASNTTDRADDMQLAMLASYGWRGHGVGIRLLVDGVLISGAVAPRGSFADLLKAEARASVAAYDEPGQFTELLDSGIDGEAKVLEDREQELSELWEKYGDEGPLNIDTLDLEDVDRFYNLMLERGTIDLRSVTVAVPGWDHFEVSTMRVRRDSISAWWPMAAQGTPANYVNDPPESAEFEE